MDDSLIKENDKKKRYLKRYKKNIALIERLEDKLVDLNNRIYKIKSPSLSGMPKGSQPVDLSYLISDKEELFDRIKRLKKKGKKLKAETLSIIDELDDVRYAEVLEAFFIDRKTFEDISEDMGYTTRHVIKLYTEAISSISITSLKGQ